MDIQVPIDRYSYLSTPKSEDAEELYELIDENREHLGKFLDWVQHSTSSQDSLNFIKSLDHSDLYNEKLAFFVIHRDKIVGVVDFREGRKSSNALEIGYWLSKEHLGKGLMTKACAALIDYAFKNSDVNRIVINTDTRNYKSQAVPSRLGFTREGVGRDFGILKGEYYDVNVNSILRSEWISQQIAYKYVEALAAA